MDPAILAFVASVFVFAGTIKGLLGLGLPPIAMGLLVIVLTPVEAAALMVLPAIITNVWQGLNGPYLRALLVRLWPVFVCAVGLTLLGAGWLTNETARVGGGILGAILAVYAATSLVTVQWTVPRRSERFAGPVVGTATGAITAVTGVSSIPVVPYFLAIGLQRDSLVQAMGLSFTLSNLALGATLTGTGALTWSTAPSVAVALAAVFGGIWLGQRLRRRVDPAVFRRWFLVGLLVLGLYLIARSLF